MSYTRNPTLSALWLSNPDEAKARCRIALAAAKTTKGAALALNVHLSTLRRWIHDYEIPNPHAHEPREAEKTLGDSPWPDVRLLQPTGGDHGSD